MANDASSFFYWYRRYKVRAQDMNAFQEAMVETARGLGEGTFGAAVLTGFQPSVSGGFSVNITPGITTAPTGYLGVSNDTVTLDCSSANGGTLPCRSLVVATPNTVDANFINSPTAPFNQVPLNQLQEISLVVIPGTPSQTPDYPAVGPNDVVLFGLNIPANTTMIASTMFDYQVRDSIGKNSQIAQNQVLFDNRLRPYRLSPMQMGIKPAQNIGAGPAGFSYPGRLMPSAYPQSAGSFNPIDAIVNFSTGLVSGGDTTTAPFMPMIPGGNLSIVCLVTLVQTDILRFNYGNQGGYAQCLSAIQNQTYSGPGGLPALDGNFPIAYVIVSSNAGTISDIQVLDARPFLGSGSGSSKFKNEVPEGAVDGINNIFTLSIVPIDPKSLTFLVDENILEDTDFLLEGTVVTIINSSLIPARGQSVYVKYLIQGALPGSLTPSPNSAQFYNDHNIIGAIDGSNATFVLTNKPTDQNSVFFWVDENILMDTDFTLSGQTITITNPDRIPALAQTVFAKYLYLGTISGGSGGGGGGSGLFDIFGSFISPIVVNPSIGIIPNAVDRQVIVLAPSPGSGATVVTANPPIAPAASGGCELVLKGPASGYGTPGDCIVLNPGTFLGLNGSIALLPGASISLVYMGSGFYDELSRR